MSSKPERAYPTPQQKDLAFSQSSISLHPTRILSFESLICGENTYCSFSVVLNQDLSKKNEKFQRLRSKKSEEVIPHTILTVYMLCVCIYIYLYMYVYIYMYVYRYICMCVCSVYIYTVIQNRAVERRASRCWCSMANPLTVRVLQLVQDAGRSSAIGSV